MVGMAPWKVHRQSHIGRYVGSWEVEDNQKKQPGGYREASTGNQEGRFGEAQGLANIDPQR
jgi:hypothetical protein